MAAALRENLRRRKAQSRGRSDAATCSEPSVGGGGATPGEAVDPSELPARPAID
ncbi:hypothetical protein [Allostella humosa]|nr:hypothetical protein [Stella humosa]